MCVYYQRHDEWVNAVCWFKVTCNKQNTCVCNCISAIAQLSDQAKLTIATMDELKILDWSLCHSAMEVEYIRLCLYKWKVDISWQMFPPYHMECRCISSDCSVALWMTHNDFPTVNVITDGMYECCAIDRWPPTAEYVHSLKHYCSCIGYQG